MTNDTENSRRAMRPRHEDPPRSTRHDTGLSSHMPARIMAQEHPLAKNPAAMDTTISIAVDPVALITTECITVTSAMRKHARWAHSSVSAILGGGPAMAAGSDISRLPRQNDRSLGTAPIQSGQVGRIPNGTGVEDDSLASRWGLRGKKGKSMQDNPLLSAFAHLRNDLRGCTGGTLAYNGPLKELIFSQTSGASTSPLCSILSFKSYALPRLQLQSPLLQSLQ